MTSREKFKLGMEHRKLAVHHFKLWCKLTGTPPKEGAAILALLSDVKDEATQTGFSWNRGGSNCERA